MKKIYNKPTTIIVKMKIANMIATSINMYGENATGEAMGRGRRNWDEFDELDEDLW